MLILASCGKPSGFEAVDSYPEIYPDYVGVTVPEGIAELRFDMADGRRFTESRRDMGDSIMVSVKAWNKGDRKGVEYKAFPIYRSSQAIDPYVAYRLIEPGYESWHDIGIYQRELASFDERAIVTNEATGKGCLNCHSFCNGDPENIVFHARGRDGGTVFAFGDDARIVNLADVGPKRQGTYSAWHPGGRYLVFTSNTTHQSFQIGGDQPIEVYDTASDIIMVDLQTDSVTVVFDTPNTLETFASWSDDGRTLYYCAAPAVENVSLGRGGMRYSLMAIDFEDGRFIGEPREVFSREDISVSFPRIKGDYLLFTASAYGTFPIWHREADLWLLNLRTGEAHSADVLNSPEAESYHSWSSNGRWVVFGSRRDDGRYTRLYIASFDGNGHFGKPFMLPQKTTDFDMTRLKSYNIPEFLRSESPDRQDQTRQLFR